MAIMGVGYGVEPDVAGVMPRPAAERFLKEAGEAVSYHGEIGRLRLMIETALDPSIGGGEDVPPPFVVLSNKNLGALAAHHALLGQAEEGPVEAYDITLLSAS